MSRLHPVAILIFALMLATALATLELRASVRTGTRAQPIQLEGVIPRQFGSWQQYQGTQKLVVNPQTQQLLDKLYNQILSRTYTRHSDEEVMLSIAYGSDQRGELQAHKPEVCYPAQGFKLLALQPGQIDTPYGSLQVMRLDTEAGLRREHVTYWLTSGDGAVANPLQRRLQELRFALTGRIPDGVIFRVSTLGRDSQRAQALQDEFVLDLLATIAPTARQRLSGL